MTKAELLAAIAAAPDDTLIYVVDADSIGRSHLDAEYDAAEQGIFIVIKPPVHGLEKIEDSEERTSHE
jgi:hypothetical protein